MADEIDTDSLLPVKLPAIADDLERYLKKIAEQPGIDKAEESTATKEEQATGLLKGMTPAQIMAVNSAIYKKF